MCVFIDFINEFQFHTFVKQLKLSSVLSGTVAIAVCGLCRQMVNSHEVSEQSARFRAKLWLEHMKISTAYKPFEHSHIINVAIWKIPLSYMATRGLL